MKEQENFEQQTNQMLEVTETEDFELTEDEIEAEVEELETQATSEAEGTPKLTGLAAYIHDIKPYPFLTRAEQDEIWETRDPAGIKRIINGHLRFVIDIVNNVYPYNYRTENNFMDLIQAGNIGLAYAATTFDPSRKTKFITHANYWIRAYVRAEYNNIRCGAIRKPVHVITAFSILTKTEEKLTQMLNRVPTIDDLKVALEDVFTGEKLEMLLQHKSNAVVSLDAQFSSNEKENTLMNYLADTSLDEQAEEDEFNETVEQSLQEALTPVQYFIIQARFGLGEFEDNSKKLEEVATLLYEHGFKDRIISRERVRQIEEDALKILKDNPTLVNLVAMNGWN